MLEAKITFRSRPAISTPSHLRGPLFCQCEAPRGNPQCYQIKTIMIQDKSEPQNNSTQPNLKTKTVAARLHANDKWKPSFP